MPLTVYHPITIGAGGILISAKQPVLTISSVILATALPNLSSRPTRLLPLAFLVRLLDNSDDRNTAEPLLQQVEGVTLGHDHEEAVERTHERGVFLWLQELKSEEREDGRFDQLDEFVRLLQEGGCDLDLAEPTDQVGGVFVVL